MPISKIEIDFRVPVETPKGWGQKLDSLIREVCDKYDQENPGRVMWPFGHGFKCTYMPMTAEEEKHRGSEYDDSIYHVEVAEREDYGKSRGFKKVRPAVFPRRTTDG